MRRSLVQARVAPTSFPSSLRLASTRRSIKDRKHWRTVGPFFVPQQEAWVVEYFGKFARVLEPGLNFVNPITERVAYIHTLKTDTTEINEMGVTTDNVQVQIDGVLFWRVLDAYKASYSIVDNAYAIEKLAQATMRAEIGKLTLDQTFSERDKINYNIRKSLNSTVGEWGLDCLRYEIKDIRAPKASTEALELQMIAERDKRAQVIRSEAAQQAAVNAASGAKQAVILAAEGKNKEIELLAQAQASAIRINAKATAEALHLFAKTLENKNSRDAVSLRIAEEYVNAFSKLAKSTNTVLLPANTGDVSSMVGQALGIFQGISGKVGKPETASENNKGLVEEEMAKSLEESRKEEERRKKEVKEAIKNNGSKAVEEDEVPEEDEDLEEDKESSERPTYPPAPENPSDDPLFPPSPKQ